jgi:hypothetical protein
MLAPCGREIHGLARLILDVPMTLNRGVMKFSNRENARLCSAGHLPFNMNFGIYRLLLHKAIINLILISDQNMPIKLYVDFFRIIVL